VFGRGRRRRAALACGAPAVRAQTAVGNHGLTRWETSFFPTRHSENRCRPYGPVAGPRVSPARPPRLPATTWAAHGPYLRAWATPTSPRPRRKTSDAG